LRAAEVGLLRLHVELPGSSPLGKRDELEQETHFIWKLLSIDCEQIYMWVYMPLEIEGDQPLRSMPSVLSGNPQSTPNGGYTKRVIPFLWIDSSFCMSSSSSEMSLRFSSMREGVTDFASTEELRATTCVSMVLSSVANARPLTMVTQQHRSGSNAMLLRHLPDLLVLEQRRPRAAQRTVRRDVNALLLAEVNDFLLGQQRVVFDLVGGGDDGGLREELLEVLDRVVGDADGFDLVWVGLDEGFEVLPGLDVGYAVVDVAGAVFEFGEERVVSWGVLAIHSFQLHALKLEYTPFGFIGTGQCIRYKSTYSKPRLSKLFCSPSSALVWNVHQSFVVINNSSLFTTPLFNTSFNASPTSSSFW